MLIYGLNLLITVTLCPEEFLKVKGVHFIVFLIAYADGCDLVVVDSQK